MLYNSLENKVFVSTNAIFHKYDYINNDKSCIKVVLKELESDRIRKHPYRWTKLGNHNP